MAARAWIRQHGEPQAGCEGLAEARIAVILEDKAGPAVKGEKLFVAINVQGKMREREAAKTLAQYLFQCKADWAVATETQLGEGLSDTFGTNAAKYSCLPADEGGGNTGGLAHFYPKNLRRYTEWWEPMAGRILVAKLAGSTPRWVVGVYAPAVAGKEREKFWEWIRTIRVYAEENHIRVLWGGDWNAVPDPEVDRSSKGGWVSTGDKGMQRTMVGMVVDVTAKSGSTWKDSTGEKWARIDAWWAMKGMEVRMEEQVHSLPTAFSQH